MKVRLFLSKQNEQDRWIADVTNEMFNKHQKAYIEMCSLDGGTLKVSLDTSPRESAPIIKNEDLSMVGIGVLVLLENFGIDQVRGHYSQHSTFELGEELDAFIVEFDKSFMGHKDFGKPEGEMRDWDEYLIDEFAHKTGLVAFTDQEKFDEEEIRVFDAPQNDEVAIFNSMHGRVTRFRAITQQVEENDEKFDADPIKVNEWANIIGSGKPKTEPMTGL